MPETVGPWLLLRPLGSGGMGVVHLARHEGTGAAAAVKVIARDDTEARRALRREARILAGLDHPAIVRLVEDGSAAATPWYAMELLTGRSLAEELGTGTAGPRTTAASEPDDDHDEDERPLPRPAPEVREWDPGVVPKLGWLAGIAHALAHLHALGLVHSDVKPANVVVEPDGRAVLVDFGLVAVRGPRTDPDTIARAARFAGTAAYMSPERARGREYDARADLYALGCMLYEVVSGAPPFDHPSAVDVLLAHLYTAPVPLAERVRGVPDALADLVRSLLEKDPERRHGRAVSVVRVLEDLGAPAPRWPLPTTAPLFHPTLQGRKAELAALEAVVGRALASGGSGRVIVGESGLGKSRLASGLAASFAQGGGRRVLAGGATALQTGAVPAPSGIPLELFADPLRDVCDRAATDPAVAAAIAPAAGVLRAWLPFFASVPGAEPEPPAADSAASARGRVHRAVLACLDAGGDRDTPTLLVLDDLQWADDLSIGALDLLLRSLGRRPWVVLGLLRAEADDRRLEPILALAPAVRIGRLGAGDVAAMVREMLGEEPHAELLASVARHANGNPLFVGECLRGAVADGALALDGEGRWSFADTAAAGLPASLDALVGARLAALSPEAGAVVRAAAVLGRTIDRELLAEVVGHDVDAALDELGRRAILDGDAFAHDRLVEQVYAGIEPWARAAFHRRAADALVRRGADPGQVGWHREQAGEHDAARVAYLDAAASAVRRLALAEGEQRFRDALRLASGLDAARIRGTLAHVVLLPQGRHDEARDLLETTITAMPAGPERLELELDRARSVIRTAPADALRAFEAVVRDATVLGQQEVVAAALSEAGAVHMRSGRPERGLELQEEALRIAGREEALVTYRQRKASALNILGRNEEALAVLDEVIAHHRAVGNPGSEAFAHSARANVLTFEGRRDEAIESYRAAYALQQRIGNRASQGALLSNWSSVLHHLGRNAEAEAQLREALAIHLEVGDLRFEGISRRALASILVTDGRLAEAVAELDAAEVALVKVGDPLWLGHVDALRSRILRWEGDAPGAVAAIERCLERYRAVKVRAELADGLQQLIRCRIAFGGDPAPVLVELGRLAVGAPPDSMLDRSLRAAEAVVEADARGEPLLYGERPEDVPPALLDRMRATTGA